MYRDLLFAVMTPIAAASLALAHDGPRVWIDTAGGRIATYDGPYPPGTNTSLFHPERVFAVEMADANDDDGVDWQTLFPGYQRLPSGAALGAGTTFSYDIVAEPIRYVPGVGSTAGTFETLSRHFGATGTPRFVVSNELGENRFTTTGFVTGTRAYRYNAEGDHGHLAYSLQGLSGGTALGGADGIYALQLELTAPGLATSLPYYVVLGKNADPTQLADAKAALEGAFVPEPASIGLLALGGLSLSRHRSRSSK